MNNKKELRALMKEKRRALPLSQRKLKDTQITEHLIGYSKFLQAEHVLIYNSFGFEIDTKDIIEFAKAIGKYVYFPRVNDETDKMDFVKIDETTIWNTSNYGIEEPISGEIYQYAENSICIVPALCVDEKGYRIGYGKGFYDKFLGNFFIESAVLVYDDFIIESIFPDNNDISINCIISESGLKRAKSCH